ncbi:MAG: ATP-binding cassette domain-containing protein [Spirochaetia bacterium]|jgi:ribose transport system ATP-binding protein
MIDFKRIDTISAEMIEKLNIKPKNMRYLVESLSGGNQQKVVLAKWLALNPKLLILDEPTRGIDVVSKEEIYRLMERLAAQGVSMLVVSSEMQEVLGIADRILVMHEGKIRGELQKADFSEENVVKLST